MTGDGAGDRGFMHISVINMYALGLVLVLNVCVPKHRGLVWDTAADKYIQDTS